MKVIWGEEQQRGSEREKGEKKWARARERVRERENADSHQWLTWKSSDRVPGKHPHLRGVLSSARGGERECDKNSDDYFFALLLAPSPIYLCHDPL